MKANFIHTICAVCAGILCSCNSFLDVQPEDKFTQEQVIKAEAALNANLNGIYMNTGRNSLYGATMTKTTLDVLARYYDVGNPNQNAFRYKEYEYGQSNVQATFANLWANAYTQILAVNKFVEMLDQTQAAIPKERKDILRGEALGLRAFFHFDMLRLFGPVYNSADSLKACIPYRAALSDSLSVSPLLPANVIMDNIVADLGAAESLLRNDPVVTQGVVTTPLNDVIADFYIRRNYRMNYYAVKALQARVWLWRGNAGKALAAAKTVIDAQSDKLFPWVSYSVVSNTLNPDRVFSSEVIFGLDNRNLGSGRPDMYTTSDIYFPINALSSDRLFVRPARFIGQSDAMFDSENDYRYAYVWPVEGAGRSFMKYSKPANPDTLRCAYFQPLIRISEMYYIAAECEPSLPVAATYLNSKVRPARGLATAVAIYSRTDLQNQLTREYRREFAGEGQLFFYYKRQKMMSIPDGCTDTGNYGMTAAKYVVPLPQKEQDAR